MKNHLRSNRLLLAPTMFALFAFIVVACGGGSGSGTGSDEDYVKALCSATSNFETSLDSMADEAQKIFENTDNEADATKKLAALFTGPFADFADDLDKASPPADVKETHDELVKALRTLVKQIDDGDEDALSNSDEMFDGIEPSQAIQDRLKAASENVAACDGQDLFE